MGRGVHWPLLKIRRDFHWCRCGDRTFGDLSVLRFKPGDEMIERITSAFDWVYELPIESQCHFAIGLSFFGFVVAAAVRETVKHSGVRCLARAIGAGSFFAVAAFAHYVAHENEKLNSELMVRKGQHVSPVASFVTSMVVEIQTPNGTAISWGGGEPVSVRDRRSFGHYVDNRFELDHALRTNASPDDVPNDAHADGTNNAKKF